ncbi:hypothetical protein GCM10011583_36570 [Streptomyces camponoticapitis]|uniref:Uncharacterized protein n=1 Tax=Streptomyces camponoticapitis TaxID=1616125 RepID=A0ABQ2E929_9ACTN|nr:hypothetical protein [Streptomyces camponoticapitis]GGK01660.1 hypothetical protein GCM10011583_36570 [Streptomyces camponoticapitis]
METDMESGHGPKGPMGTLRPPPKREGRLRTCLPARVTTAEHETRDGRGRQETVDQDWNVVRGED